MTLKRNLAWMGLGQISFFAVQFGGTVVLARILTPAEMGVFAVAAALVGVLSLVQSFGLGNFIIREASLGPAEVATAFTANVAIAGLLTTAILIAGAITSNAAGRPEIGEVLYALSLLPLIGIFQLVPYALLERAGRFKALVGVNVTRQLIATLFTVGFALAGFRFLSLAYGQVTGALAGAILVNVIGRRHVQLRLSLKGWRRVLGFGGQMVFINGVNAFATRLSELALARFAGLANLGLFNRATTLYTLFWENLHVIIGRVLFVDLAARRRNGESLRGPYLMIVEITTSLLWPAFSGLAILAPPLFVIVYGERWLPAAAPFSILAVSAIIQTSITMTWEIFVVCGETRRQAKIEVLRAIVGTALFAWACTISLNAAAAARVADAVFSMFLYRPHLQRMTDTRFGDVLRIYGRSTLLTAVAVGPATALMIMSEGSPYVPLWQVTCAVLLGMAAWALTLVALRHPLFVEVSRLLARRSPNG